ncbi:hypothetical protein GCK72_025149 [Caenorhabditis remanei]|uniref:Uncharacterized protein n=2 Tax=Caenorhabditis remanei TaxID=31234 RepID=E3MZD2_CAERE|nr:hypothetical protein GCK72_025149 [Caenorhabditis remanei]EFP12865.1 hypothetical protein CRE_05933 [Caenorhabditis remanei]KAF1748682.1 hypothetical protein GCK72_025149 [Caenorhabditis remanei]
MSSEPLPISKLPTDFSELHKQEMARREKEEQENNKWVFEKPTAEENQKPAEPRRLSPEEIALWESLGDSNDEDEEEERIDKESLKRKCRNHINNRLQILKEGTEEILTTRGKFFFIYLHV